MPTTVTTSTSVVLVATSSNTPPYIVLLPNISTVGRIITVRDNDGFASLANNILLSTTAGAIFSDGTNSISINQPYGFITFNTNPNGVYYILNTFAFPAGQAAANVSNLTASSITTRQIFFTDIGTPSTNSIYTSSSVLYLNSTALGEVTASNLTSTVNGLGSSGYLSSIAAVSPSVWVAVGRPSSIIAASTAGSAQYSTDSFTWVNATGGFFGNGGNSVAYADGLFVAVGDNNDNVGANLGYNQWSVDGSNWNYSTTPAMSFDQYRTQVNYNNGLWHSVGANPYGGPRTIQWSTDGKTWNDSLGYPFPSGGGISGFATGITYGNGVWVASGFCESVPGAGVIWSSDGSNWSNATAVSWTGSYINGVAFDGSRFVCLPLNGTNTNASNIAYSTDGKSWSSSGITGGNLNNGAGQVSGNGSIWLITSGGGAPNQGKYLIYSTDALTWNSNTTFSACNDTTRLTDPYYDGATWWVGLQNNASTQGIFFSGNGISWDRTGVTSRFISSGFPNSFAVKPGQSNNNILLVSAITGVFQQISTSVTTNLLTASTLNATTISAATMVVSSLFINVTTVSTTNETINNISTQNVDFLSVGITVGRTAFFSSLSSTYISSSQLWVGSGNFSTLNVNTVSSTSVVTSNLNVNTISSGLLGVSTIAMVGNVTITGSGNSSVAIGNAAGATTQGGYAIAIGGSAGATTQGGTAVAIGLSAGRQSQSTSAVAIGENAGYQSQGICAIAIGSNAGSNSQGNSGIAIGILAARNTQGISGIAIGSNAGGEGQHTNAIAIGQNAGAEDFVGRAQSTNAIAIGKNAGKGYQGPNAIAIGESAGGYNNNISFTGQGSNAIAIGSGAGSNIQGIVGLAIGFLAGQSNQGLAGVAIGSNAGNANQATNAIAIGSVAGQTNQSTNAIAIGRLAGTDTQYDNAIAIGAAAGNTTQRAFTTAIGYYAGNFNQQQAAIAIGTNAGSNTQSVDAVAIGNSAGISAQGRTAVAVGTSAGALNQGSNAVAIGPAAGYSNQTLSAVAIGFEAGKLSQSTTAVAIGNVAGYSGQRDSAIAIGSVAGFDAQRAGAVAIGANAGQLNQGLTSIAIGFYAGTNNQAANSIVLNASGSQLDTATTGTFNVKPVRTQTFLTGQTLGYNSTTSEIVYGVPSSDRRIKKNIETANLNMCYSTMRALPLKYFEWNFPIVSSLVSTFSTLRELDENASTLSEVVSTFFISTYTSTDVQDKRSLGYIAQDVEEIFPKSIFKVDQYGYDDFKGLDTDQIVKMHYGATQKTMEIIDTQSTLINQLEGQVSTINSSTAPMYSTIETQSTLISQLEGQVSTLLSPTASAPIYTIIETQSTLIGQLQEQVSSLITPNPP